MGTGYMGMDEPEVVPQGEPQVPEQQQEQPVAEASKQVETPVSDTPIPPVEQPVAEEPKVVEKIVEKIVEKYPEFKDESAKELYERFVNGDTEGIYNYLSEVKKNYDTMSDLDVVRAGLALKNPQWSAKDVELEIRAEYGQALEKYSLDDVDKELEPDTYKEYEAHNKRVDDNLLRVERAARDNRILLKEKQRTIELPKISKEDTPVSDAPVQTQEQLDEAKRLWAEAAVKQVPNLTDYKFQVGDDKNSEEVVFAITPEEKTARVEAMKTWNGADFMQQRGWQYDDGSFNLLKIAEDVHTLENLPKIIKSVYTQAKVGTTKEVITDIKNLDLSEKAATSVAATPQDVGSLIWA